MDQFKFGSKSQGKLATCCQEIRLIAPRALYLSPYDFTIIHGWRGEEIQNALFESNASTKQWPESNHNHMSTGRQFHGVRKPEQPNSHALDFAPWIEEKIPWSDTHIFAVIAGCFFAAGKEQGITLSWGGDFNSNGSTKDQLLLDYGHIEVVV